MKNKKKEKDICLSCRKCSPIPKNIEQCREWEDLKVWRNNGRRK